MSLAIRFDDIRKDFGPVRVLHGVSFELAPGRVYGLLGENGAGKSTLMKILAGYETATSGTLLVDGHAQQFIGSRDAEAAGHRADSPGVQSRRGPDDRAEHLSRPREEARLVRRRRRDARRGRAFSGAGRAEKAPDTKVRELIVAEKQMVEIAKALSRRARLLIMDEPTATLTPAETERLFTLIAQLKADGVTIVYISHKLDEVERITDEVIVMRDGRFVARSETAGLARQQMANLMVGRELSDMFPDKTPCRRRADRAEGRRPHGAGLGRRPELRSARRRNPRLCGPGRRGPHRSVRRAARPARRTAGRIEIAGRRADLRSPRDACATASPISAKTARARACTCTWACRRT